MTGVQTCALPILFFYNHGDDIGSATWSTYIEKQPDEELTKKIVGAGKILDIRLLDHLIISEDTYFSFADEGIILWMRWFVNKDLFLAYDTPYERLWNAKNWLHLFRC